MSDDKTPPAAAVANGHDLVWDPPAVMSSIDRWTCRRCGDAALRHPSCNEYGSAVEQRCPEADQ